MKNFSLSLTTKREFDLKINALLSDNPHDKHYVHITKKPKKRGVPANAQQHVFYFQIATARGDIDEFEAKNMCKHMFGLSIMLASPERQELTVLLLHSTNFYSRPYEEQLRLMPAIVRTSEFNTQESKRYMDMIIAFFNEQGIMINYQD